MHRRRDPEKYLDDPEVPPDQTWDADVESNVLRVLPGYHRISRRDDLALVTVLGSCVSACIRDPIAKVGGMNHFMLPGELGQSWKDATSGMRYGHFAMERLINDLLAEGARKDRLEVKVFGGSAMIQSNVPIGDNNAAFVLGFLKEERLKVAAQDLGGINARRVYYFPSTGRVFRLELKRQLDRKIFDHEVRYRGRLKVEPDESDVELF